MKMIEYFQIQVEQLSCGQKYSRLVIRFPLKLKIKTLFIPARK